MPDPLLLEVFQRLAMAFGIGFLVGVERGWRHRGAPEGSRAAGLRTHALIGVLGAVAASLLPSVGAVGFAGLTLAFAAALIVFKVRESALDADVSVTGTIAALIVFALGAYAMVGDLRVAAAIGVGLAAVLALKPMLHEWLDRLTWPELRSALLILAATAIALPLLPDRAIDPWGAINPRELWLLTILVAGASFAGYVAVRVFGRDVGLLAGAAAGAFVSSTIVTAELARSVRAGQTPAAVAAAGAALAAAVSLARVTALAAIAAAPIVVAAAPSLLSAALVFAAAAFWLRGRAKAFDYASAAMRSPLELGSVAQFALLLGGLIIFGRLVLSAFGQSGLLSFAATAGVVDVDAVALAAGSLVRRGLTAEAGAQALLLAALVNTGSKAVLAGLGGGWRFAGFYALAALAAALTGVGVWVLL